MYLTMIANANNSRSSMDGLFQSLEDNQFWVINCTHGDKDGTMTLRWGDNWISIIPENLRAIIRDLTGVIIPVNDIILINPCHPRQVKEIYQSSFIENNIDCIGDWDGITKNLVQYFPTLEKYRISATSHTNVLYDWI